MRHHGWELPYHPLQVVAMAVFLALGFAFYVFFAPFVGSHVLELISISIYSPLMVSVFGLYIWCAAINPADPAVMQSKKPDVAASRRTSPSFLFSAGKNDTSTEPSVVTHPSSAQSGEDQEERRCYNPAAAIKANKIAIMAGGLAVSNTSACDDCINCGYNSRQTCYDETLYCSLCEVEISKCSKHCRVCDKCVDRFDHHCRWLNNCIGRRNYRIFIALVISGVSLLILQWAIGVWVMARCFLNRVELIEDIKYKLGGSFSLVPFLIVVSVCTVLAAFATLPLLQLSLFHALLIHKGISTYDYIVAMREKEQQHGVAESMPSPYASSGSPAATGMSVASSMDAGNHSPWCTPPHGELGANQNVPRKNVATEAIRKGSGVESGAIKKPQPKISPWMLARLNTEDAIRAGIEARRKSSILRPVIRTGEGHNVIPETDVSGGYTSSDVMTDVNASFTPLRDIKIDNPPLTKCRDIKVSAMIGVEVKDDNLFPECPGSSKRSAALTPLQVEARNAFCQSAGSTIVQSGSSSARSEGSPGARISCESYLSNPSGHHNLHLYNNGHTDSTMAKPVTAWFMKSNSDGYEASGGESADDSDPHNYRFNIQQQYAQWNDPVRFNVNQHIQTPRMAGSIIPPRNVSRGTMANTTYDGSSMEASRRSMEMVSSDNDSRRSVFRYVDSHYQRP